MNTEVKSTTVHTAATKQRRQWGNTKSTIQIKKLEEWKCFCCGLKCCSFPCKHNPVTQPDCPCGKMCDSCYTRVQMGTYRLVHGKGGGEPPQDAKILGDTYIKAGAQLRNLSKLVIRSINVDHNEYKF